MVNMSKMKKAFHNEGIQITTDTMNMLREEVNKTILEWVNNTKNGHVKRLTPNLIWIALRRFDQKLNGIFSKLKEAK